MHIKATTSGNAYVLKLLDDKSLSNVFSAKIYLRKRSLWCFPYEKIIQLPSVPSLNEEIEEEATEMLVQHKNCSFWLQ